MRNFLTAFGVFLAAAIAQFGAAHAVGEDVFVVPRVPVQAQAESATAAKAIAQSQGRRRAMDILLRRVTVEEDWIYLPRLATGEAAPVSGGAADEQATTGEFDPYATAAAGGYSARQANAGGKTAVALTDHDLETLESSFEVYSEKSSSTTYRALITYRFKPDAVRRLLKNARLPYSETQTRTALVLPVLQTDKSVYLWEQNNPWMAAWKARPYINELTPMTAPLGDLEDTQIITAEKALALDPAALAALAEHYSVSQVIVAHARLRQQDGSDNLNVRLINGFRESGAVEPDEEFDPLQVNYGDEADVSHSSAAPEFAAKIGDVLAQIYLTEPSGDFPGLAERAIESAIAKYAKGWKERTLIDHSSEAVLETTAFFRSIDDWTKIRAGLIATPLVGSVQVYALSPSGAEMRLKVFGDPQRLAVAMENYGVVFWTEEGEQWFLATPQVASSVKGSRNLKRKRGFLSEDQSGQDGDAGIENASGVAVGSGIEEKIDQIN